MKNGFEKDAAAKAAHAAYMRQYYQDNREKLREAARKRNQLPEVKERRKEHNQRYWKKRAEKMQEK